MPSSSSRTPRSSRTPQPPPPAEPSRSGHSPADVRRGSALLLAAGALWGTSGPAGHLLQDLGVAPMAIAAHRLLIAGLLLTGFLLVTGRLSGLRLRRAILVRLGVNALLHAVFQLLYFASLALIPVGLSTIVKIGSVPVFVTLGLVLAARSLPSLRTVGPVLAAMLGIALLAGFPATDGTAAQTAGGIACALGAGLSFAVMSLVNRTPVEGLPPLANAGLGMLAGGVLLLPAAAPAGLAVPATAEALGLLLFLGTVPTVFSYAAYFTGLRTASDSAMAMAVLAEPLTATAISVAFLGEALSPVGGAGAALLFAALSAEPAARALAGRRKRRRAPSGGG